MRVLYLCHTNNYHIRKWIPALRRHGLEIFAATLRAGEPFEDGTPVFRLMDSPLRHHSDFVRCVPRLKSLIKTLNPDLIFASYAPGYGLSAMLSGFKPYVVQTWSRDAELPGSLTSFSDHLLVKTAGRLVIKMADGVTADGLYCAELLQSRYRFPDGKLLATPWGIDVGFFRRNLADIPETLNMYNIDNGSPVLLVPRGIFWYYKPEIVLPALLLVAKQHPHITIILLSLEHQKTTAVAGLVDALLALKNVRIIDRFLNEEEMRNLWAVSTFFLSSPVFDGVSEAITEGRAMGAIPILNRIGSNLERAIPGIHAYYINDTTADLLSESITWVLKKPPAEIRKMQQANQDWVQAFGDVSDTCLEIVRFFKSVAEK